MAFGQEGTLYLTLAYDCVTLRLQFEINSILLEEYSTVVPHQGRRDLKTKITTTNDSRPQGTERGVCALAQYKLDQKMRFPAQYINPSVKIKV